MFFPYVRGMIMDILDLIIVSLSLFPG